MKCASIALSGVLDAVCIMECMVLLPRSLPTLPVHTIMSSPSRLFVLLRCCFYSLRRVLSRYLTLAGHSLRLLCSLLARLNRRPRPKGSSGGEPGCLSHLGSEITSKSCVDSVSISASTIPPVHPIPMLDVHPTRSTSNPDVITDNDTLWKYGERRSLSHSDLGLSRDDSGPLRVGGSCPPSLTALHMSVNAALPSRSAMNTRGTSRHSHASVTSLRLEPDDISRWPSNHSYGNDALFDKIPFPSEMSLAQASDSHENSGTRICRSSLPSPRLSISSFRTALTKARSSSLFNDESSGLPHSRSDVAEYKSMIIFPITPLRRSHRVLNLPTVEPEFTVPAMSGKFSRTVALPPGWTEYIHPEGSPYFFNSEKKIITDNWIYDVGTYDDIKYSAEKIHAVARENGLTIPVDARLVLEIFPSEVSTVCGYYYVNHSHRCLFWVEDFKVDYLLRAVHAPVEPCHFNHVMEAQYWRHREQFPALYYSDARSIRDLKSRLRFSLGDLLTSTSTTIPWDPAKLQVLIGLIDQIDLNDTNSDPHSEVLIARAFYDNAQWRWLNFHGEKNHRLHRARSMHQSTAKKRPLFMRLISPLLFYAPDLHIRSLRRVFVDHVVIDVDWKVVNERLVKDLQEFLLLGEVLLTANLSFLAIQSVDLTNAGGDAPPARSRTQLACYVSILSTLGSIVLGLVLVRRSRSLLESPSVAHWFFERMERTFLGLESVAIIFSLPYALLMWGMISFTVAFCSLCLTGTNFSTRMIVSSAGCLVLLLIFWNVWSFWERDGLWGLQWWRLQWWRLQRVLKKANRNMKSQAGGAWRATLRKLRGESIGRRFPTHRSSGAPAV
ncbi:hypothetical protein PLICRDRAFT_124960 [Plicaturopsis crispa FD-325 SS-3]|nr:hypothetical protein PLICRDRAFT_124960 [Plicaturopsis crispa FD-325 SS-3]